MYIHKKQKHLSSFNKQMPAMTSNRISNIFVMKSALMKLHLSTITHSKKTVLTKILTSHHHFFIEKTQRSLICFDSLFSSILKSKIGKILLLSQTNTSQNTIKDYKLFNRNNIKISYICIQNVSSVIQFYNANLLKRPATSSSKKCCCDQKCISPLLKKC